MSEKEIKREGWSLDNLSTMVIVPWELQKITLVLHGMSYNDNQPWGFPIDITWTGRDYGGYYVSEVVLPESMTGYDESTTIDSWIKTDSDDWAFTNGPRFTFNDKEVRIRVSKCYLYGEEEVETLAEIEINIE